MSLDSKSATLPFTVLGGYLGAGKTTLLNQLLTNAQGLRLAVLVNDFGSVNIDMELVRSHDGDTINLTNGCICCSLVNGFAAVIGEICKRAAEFDHMVIEASGVANPARIAQYGQMYELPLDGILLLVDAEQIRTQAANKYVGDTVLRQFQHADLIVLNKTDLVSSEYLADLRIWLNQLSPGTPVIETTGAKIPVDIVLGTGVDRQPAALPAATFNESSHSRIFGTWTLESREPLSTQLVERFATALGDDIYRAKGFVYLRDQRERRYVFQQVGSRWSVEPGDEWGREQAMTRLVVIGREGAVDPASLKHLLNGQ
ncbi:MAG: CobW family GTP-binding protein [Pirellulaceae bacterium]